LTAASCPKKDFYTSPPPKKKKVQQTFVLHTQNSACFVLRTQKSAPKKQAQKSWQKRLQKGCKKGGKKGSKKSGKKGGKKSLFLNLSCCCLETSLKPVLFFSLKT